MAGELLSRTKDQFSFLGKYNGFPSCIQEITEDDLIAQYGPNYSYCDLDYVAKLTYMVHEVSFSPAPFTYTGIGVNISLGSPIHSEKPRERLCGGGINESDTFFGTPPFFLDYYFYDIYVGFNPGTLYRILRSGNKYRNPGESEDTVGETRYIFLNDYLSGGESFSVYYDAAGAIDDVGYFISMHNNGSSLGTVTIDGKVFYEYLSVVQGSGTGIPRITGVTFYRFPE